MTAMPYHRRYHSDALAGFMSLTLEERGAYQTLLDMIYDRGGPLIDNERLLAGYMGCSIRKWRLLRDSLIEKGKIYITPQREISNSRAEKEIENSSKTHRKLIENGSSGARKKIENAKKINENNEGDEVLPEQNSSHTRVLPEARSYREEVDKSTPSQRKRYSFEGKTIRLTPPDFDRWRESYHAIPDLRAELATLDDWLAGAAEDKRKKWFQVVSGSLSRKHQDRLAEQKSADLGGYRSQSDKDFMDVITRRYGDREPLQ